MKLALSVILASALILSSITARSQQPSPRPRYNQGRPQQQKSTGSDQQAKTDQHGAEQPSAVVKIIPATERDQQSSQTKAARNDEPSNNRWIGGIRAWFNGLGTGDKIATIATFVGFLQFVTLYLTVRVMCQSGRQQMRAYLSVQPNFITSFDETHFPKAKYILQNLGQTPAYRVSHRGHIAAFPQPLPKDFTLPPITGSWSSPIVLFPNVPLIGYKNKQAPFSVDELEGIRKRTLTICIFGEVRYRDAFRKRRKVKFCSSVFMESDVTLQKVASNSADRFEDVTYEIATVGNDAN